jgi:dCMP deaminase
MAQLVSMWSGDTSTKVGAVIVTPENVVASVRYNGFAQRMPNNDAHYADRETKYSRIVQPPPGWIPSAKFRSKSSPPAIDEA